VARYGARGRARVDAVSDAGCLTILERRGEELWRFLHRGNHATRSLVENRRVPATQGITPTWPGAKAAGADQGVWERPSIVTRALCKLGMKRRFVCTFEWLT